MNILMITANDPAGMGIAFTNAINRYTEHSCRLITTAEKYGLAFESDIHIPDIHDDDFGEVEQLLKSADIFHFHVLNDENSHLGPLVIRDYIKGKSILHHHHGHPDYILNVATYNEKYRKLGRKVIVSTPDLLKIATNSTWLPNLVPLDDVHYLPRYEESLSSASINICQAPTRKFHKHTDEFVRVMRVLAKQFEHIEAIVLERISHTECLKIKRQCHVIFDHMRGWFGISSLESLSQGKPVVAGLDDWNIECIRKFTGEEQLPWLIARDEESLQQCLSVLIRDPARRQEQGVKARAFMESVWTEQHVVDVLLKIYNTL